MCLNFWRRRNRLCGPFPAPLIFRPFLILRLVYLMRCSYALSVPYQNMLRGRPVLPTGLAGSLSHHAILLGAMSKNGISFLLREVIAHSGASPNDAAAPRAHSIRGIATSSAFFRNWSLSSVLEAASWRSNTVFTSFYLKDVQYILDIVHSLGPFVAAGAHLA